MNESDFELTIGNPEGGVYSGITIDDNYFSPQNAGTGQHIITYNYTDAHGCSNSASTTLKVKKVPVVTMRPLDPVCTNTPAFELSNGKPAGGIYSGPGVSNNIFYPSDAGSGKTSIKYKYTDSNGCSGISKINLWLKEGENINLGNDTVLCTGNAITLNAGNNFTDYKWSTGETTPAIRVNNGTTGSIHYSVSAINNNCKVTDTLLITFDLCSGINPMGKDYPWCYIYPSPFKNTFSIYSERKLLISIYDISGRIVETSSCQGNLIAGQDLKPGIYFVEAQFKNNKKVYKVIKAGN
jgi:hypothetical protein